MNTCLKEVVYTTVPSRLNKGEEEGKEDMGRRSRIRGGGGGGGGGREGGDGGGRGVNGYEGEGSRIGERVKE